MRRDACVVLAVVLCLAVVAGELAAYLPGVHSFDSDAAWSDGTVEYTVTSSGSDVYDAVLMSGSGSAPVTQLTIYVDEGYSEHYEEANRLVGFPYLDQEYYASQVTVALGNRGFHDVAQCGSEGLLEYLEGTLDDPSGLGLLVTSYALPSSVFTGSADDLLARWVAAGGTLYWVGSEFGGFSAGDDGLHRVTTAQTLFFGRECVRTGGSAPATSAVDNGFTEALSLKGSDVRFGVDLDGVPGSLEMGYQADGYATVGMAPYGEGAVCVFSGTFDIDQIDDVAQVVAAGVTPGTAIAGHATGNVTRGTVSGAMAAPEGADRLYVYIGGTYTKYGEVFHA